MDEQGRTTSANPKPSLRHCLETSEVLQKDRCFQPKARLRFLRFCCLSGCLEKEVLMQSQMTTVRSAVPVDLDLRLAFRVFEFRLRGLRVENLKLKDC